MTKTFKDLPKSLLSFKKVVIIVSIFAFAGFSFLAVKRHLNLDSALFDLGLEQQVVMNTANGRLMQSGIETGNYLGDHFSLITLPVALVYKVFPGIWTLLFLQNLAIVVAAVGIFLLAKKILQKNSWAITFFLIFLSYVGISGLYLFDYHPVVFALPLLIWGLYFYYVKKWQTTFLLFFLAALCKEDIGIFIGMFGLLIALKHKDRKGWLLAACGFIYSLLALFVFIPHFRGAESDTLARYSWLGNSLPEMLNTVISRPLFVISQIATFMKISYLVKMSLPLLFMFVFSPAEGMIILPSLVINLLSDSMYQNSGLYHYDIAITSGLFLASILGLQNLLAFFSQHFPQAQQQILQKNLLTLIIVCNLLFLVVHPAVKVLVRPVTRYQDYLYLQDLQQHIPKNFVISISNIPGGQFGNFEHLQLFDDATFQYAEPPDLFIIDKQVGYDDYARSKAKDLLTNGYRLLQENNSFIIIINCRKHLINKLHY